MANNAIIVVGAIVVVALFAGIWFFSVYNYFIGAEQEIENKQANLEAQYQRRVDLIPNVVATVKGSAGFEQETLTQLTGLRSQWQTQPERRVETANEIESTISKLLVIAENYPDLKSTAAFQDLIVELEGTENRIAFARTEYNDSVRKYNTSVKQFPGNFVAGVYGFSQKPYFESESGAQNAPDVDFGN